MLFSVFVYAEPESKESIKPDQMIVYKSVKTPKGKFELKLHVFNPSDHKSGNKTPCILLFHSGGWSSGDPSRYYRQCKAFASQGMVAISVEYRIKGKHGDNALASVRDAKSAVRWVRENAEKLGVDPKKIAAMGSSAGGHLAAAAGNLTAFEEDGEDLSVSSKPDALLLISPVFDNSPEGYGHHRKEVRENWKDFSPLHNISKGAPPAIVFVGDNEEKYLTVEAAKKFKKNMEAVGSRCELFVLKGATHRKKSKEHYQLISKEQKKFLKSLGYIESSNQ